MTREKTFTSTILAYINSDIWIRGRFRQVSNLRLLQNKLQQLFVDPDVGPTIRIRGELNFYKPLR